MKELTEEQQLQIYAEFEQEIIERNEITLPMLSRERHPNAEHEFEDPTVQTAFEIFYYYRRKQLRNKDKYDSEIIKADQLARMGALVNFTEMREFLDKKNPPKEFVLENHTPPPLSEEEEILFQTLQDEEEDDIVGYDCPKCDAATGHGGDPDEEGDLVITCDSCGYEDQVVNFKHVKTDS